MNYGDNMGFGDMGWTGIPAVVTTAAGTTAGNATMGNMQGVGQAASNSTTSCALCSNPKVQEGAFIIAIILLAVGWHFHLYSLLEEG